ncbi:hypothetical protein CFC21_070758 [Triticum aestivum]|uniref:Uncharacterized protein n=2 Tax=Triticum aestivum TaxID=4565 RepID=A0A9R1HGV3_WHEAT|nr:hypothetical protein CFC21_070758 [Triticum aestivum]
MASAITFKGAAPASLLKSGAPVAFCALHSPTVTTDRRPYNNQVTKVGRYDDDDDYSGCDLVIPSFLSQAFDVLDVDSADVLDPHSAPTSMARQLSPMETGLSTIAGTSQLGRWVAKEDDRLAVEDALVAYTTMVDKSRPAHSQWFNDSSDNIRGCCDKAMQILCVHYGWELGGKAQILLTVLDGDDNSVVPGYNHRMEMPADAYKINKIKAEIKNCVLWVTLLKVKEEERKNIFHVKDE